MKKKIKSTVFKGFTLIELLVVISVIALLMSIMMPALNRARESAKALVCMTNLKSVGLGMVQFVTENDGYFPASYVYPNSDIDSFNPKMVKNQDAGKPHGYLHWSWFLLGGKHVDEEVFQCPSMRHKGAPRTNPGSDAEDWSDGQIDDNGQTSSNSFVDKQAPRMAYTCNAAIVPRNKFTKELAYGGARLNRLVKMSHIKRPGSTILATEFNKNWRLVGEQQGGYVLSKSHRPVTPFYSLGSGWDVYNSNTRTPFVCGVPGSENYGLLTMDYIEKGSNLLVSSNPLNAVGRHHPGGNIGGIDNMGEGANFAYTDGHVERKHVLQTIRDRQWGNKFYSITGNNFVKYFQIQE